MFVNIWVISFSILTQSVFYLWPGRQPLEYYLCTGTDPALDSDNVKVNITLFSVYVLTIFFNIAIPIRIRLYQIKHHKSFQNEGIGFFLSFGPDLAGCWS